uniref:Uncharacterized protein n=1 Tax=Anguilla anguilla TaxID=7936 RepID=A0A0E9XF90_ANGAN
MYNKWKNKLRCTQNVFIVRESRVVFPRECSWFCTVFTWGTKETTSELIVGLCHQVPIVGYGTARQKFHFVQNL